MSDLESIRNELGWTPEEFKKAIRQLDHQRFLKSAPDSIRITMDGATYAERLKTQPRYVLSKGTAGNFQVRRLGEATTVMVRPGNLEEYLKDKIAI